MRSDRERSVLLSRDPSVRLHTVGVPGARYHAPNGKSLGYNVGMWGGVLAAGTLFVVCLHAQITLNYGQLQELLQSSLRQGLSDKEVSKYLKNQKLDFALTDRIIEEFVGWGIGPRTLNVLRSMKPLTGGLAAPEIPEPPPKNRQPPPPSEDEQARIIDEARRTALEYTDGLPDFVCLQITRRYLDPSGLEMDWLKYDEIKTRVSYFEHHENYEVLSVNNKLTGRSMHELGGATSTGEFGSMLAQLFEPATATRFQWARHSLLRGRHVYVFHFQVPRTRSRWSLSYQPTREVIITGYQGLIYIGKEAERVLRIVTSAYDIPAGFPIQEARTRLDYDYTEIAGREFLLPLKAQVRMRQEKKLIRNDVEFRLYRKFSAEATITFDELDDIEPLPDDEPLENPGLRGINW